MFERAAPTLSEARFPDDLEELRRLVLRHRRRLNLAPCFQGFGQGPTGLRGLHVQPGVAEVPACDRNPRAGVVYLELDLAGCAARAGVDAAGEAVEPRGRDDRSQA